MSPNRGRPTAARNSPARRWCSNSLRPMNRTRSAALVALVTLTGFALPALSQDADARLEKLKQLREAARQAALSAAPQKPPPPATPAPPAATPPPTCAIPPPPPPPHPP